MECDSENANSESESCLDFLTTEEKRTIPTPVFEKCKNEWNNQRKEVLRLEAELEKATTHSEQLEFKVETQLADLHKKLEEEGNAKLIAQTQLTSIKESVATLEENLQKAQDKISSLTRQLQENQAEQETTSAQCTALAASLESKTKINTDLKEQISSLQEQLTAAQRSKCDALIQAEEANTLQMQMQYKEHRYEQEKSLLSRQVELLQQQLEERSAEILSLRREHSSNMLTMQTDLNHALEEARILREEMEATQKTVEQKNKRIEELLQSLNETRESETRLESSYKKELSAQEKLAGIYKQSGEDQQKRCEELEKAVEELKQLLQQASEQYGALEKAKQHSEEEAQNSLDQRDLLIKDLKEELQKVNELLKNSSRREDDYLSELSPAASAASQLMSKGLTLSQLYAEYLNTSEKLFKAEEENKRQSRYMEQIIREIEEKAPLLRKQRDDYERAMETINTLHTQIDNYVEELEKQRLESEEALRRSDFLGRENGRLNQQVKDLSKQVTVLLTQVEAARAGLPPPPLSVFDQVPNGTTASDVIAEHLVTFREISELQEQNIKLLTSLRELTDKLESNEKTVVEARTQELTEELSVAKKELNELRSARDRMQSMMENITRQRDMYRTLVGQESKATAHVRVQGDSEASSEELEKVKKDLDRVQKDLEKARKDYEDYRQERAKNDQMERNEMEKLKSLFDQTRGENIKLLSQSEYNTERLKTLQNNCDAYQRQVSALEEKNNTLQGIVGRHEGTIETLREHILTLTKKVSQAEMTASNLREEKALLKEAEARLLAERDSLQRSQYSQSLLLSNLEAIKNNLEKSDSGLRMRHENQIADLTEQCCRLKAKIDSNVDLKEAQAKISTMEDLVNKLKDEQSNVKQTLVQAEQQVVTLKAQLKEAQQQQARNTSPSLNRGRQPFELTGARPPGTAVTSTVRELQVQLSEERAKVTSLQTSADRASADLKKALDTLQQHEAQIKDSSESNKAAQEEITSLRKSLEEAKTETKDLQEKLKAAVESEKALKELTDHRLMKITEDLEERENELEETQKKLEDAKKAEEKALAELKDQSKIALDMQDKYEKEVILHGADLKALGALKERLADHNTQLENITVAKLKAEESLNDLKSGFEQREEMLKKTIEEMKARGQELDEQNKVLLDQFTQLSEKMSAIQTKLASSEEDGGNTSFTEDEARSAEHLREIIKYLRREREVADGKLEVAESGILRLEAQKKSLEAQIDLLNKYLAEERGKNQTNLETASRYSEMMRKVHTMDALADSNRLLREEKDQLKSTLDEFKTKCSSLESQIQPLQEKLRETTAKLDSVTVEKKSLENEKDLYKKRSQELVEKLNKAKPEDMIKLQQEHNTLQKSAQSKDAEINRLKNMLTQLQKNYQAAIVNKNQLQRNLQNARDESKLLSEENKKLVQAKMTLQQQAMVSMDKIQTLEASAHQTQALQQQEQQKTREQKTQFVQQLVEARQREETTKKELESVNKIRATKDAAIKELEEKIVQLQRQNSQLRKIANKYKYKTKVESASEGGEAATQAAADEESEERKTLRTPDAPAPKTEKLAEEITKLKEEIRKKDEELVKFSSGDMEAVGKLRSDLDLKGLELQKANQANFQLKEKLVDTRKMLDESIRKKTVYENTITTLEEEKEQSLHQIKTLNKKLSMQQKMLENLQKQIPVGQKVSPSVIIEKSSSDTPPTANIKPMAAPIPTPAMSSPRSQVASQGAGSRSIPTASIRPMAPTALSASPVGVVMVSPMEAHSGGDGAVSSTVTLPQATVTPTPVAPPTLTATVSPTSVSQSSLSSNIVEGISTSLATEASHAPTPTSSGTADALISQAIALVAPHVEEISNRPKRKLEAVQEEDEEEETEAEDAKRSRLQQEDASTMEAEDERMEEEMHRAENDEDDEDTGEPSSSSSHPGGRKANEEILLILSSDEEGEAPSSQSGRVEEDREGDAGETGREAEAERSEEGEAPPSSLQPPPRPLHEPPSSSRQSLPLFHSLPHYEEGVDDRIVPSTPTLFAPRTGDGAAGDGVSSPQVPSQGFEFGSSSGGSAAEPVAPSNDGLSQIAEGGAIDVTRMDLAQLDEGTHRSVPSTPMRRSPAVEVSAEGNISSSGGDSEGQAREVSPSGPSSEALDADEPDSGIQGNQRSETVAQPLEQEEEEQQQPEAGEVQFCDEDEPSASTAADNDDQEGEDDGVGHVASSQEEGVEAEPDPDEQAQDDDLRVEEEEVDEDEEDEGEEGEVEEVAEGEEDDEEEEEEEEEQEVVLPTRATRSTAAATPQPPQGRRITPITWSEGEQSSLSDVSRPPRSLNRIPNRGSRTPPGGRGVIPPAPQLSPRFPGPSRGRQRARRSRPSYPRRGGLN